MYTHGAGGVTLTEHSESCAHAPRDGREAYLEQQL